MFWKCKLQRSNYLLKKSTIDVKLFTLCLFYFSILLCWLVSNLNSLISLMSLIRTLITRIQHCVDLVQPFNDYGLSKLQSISLSNISSPVVLQIWSRNIARRKGANSTHISASCYARHIVTEFQKQVWYHPHYCELRNRKRDSFVVLLLSIRSIDSTPNRYWNAETSSNRQVIK